MVGIVSAKFEMSSNKQRREAGAAIIAASGRVTDSRSTARWSGALFFSAAGTNWLFLPAARIDN